MLLNVNGSHGNGFARTETNEEEQKNGIAFIIFVKVFTKYNKGNPIYTKDSSFKKENYELSFSCTI